jgi:hypothetical protein
MTAGRAVESVTGTSGHRRLSVSLGRRPGEKWSRFAARIANAYGVVLLLVVATYALASLIPTAGWPAVAIALLASATTVAAFTSSAAGPKTMRKVLAASLAVVVCAVAAALSGTNTMLAVSALIELILFAAAAVAIFRTVIAEREVGFRTILGAISVYVMFGLIFTFLFLAIDRLQAGPFFSGVATPHQGDFLFFSITTLTTTGYGNLVPAAQPGKLFAGIEMLTGQIFIVTFVAGLVSLWRPRARRSEE